MKKFFECVVEWKTAAAMMFAGSVILCVVIMLFLGENTVPIPMLISIFIVSSVGTFLQYLAFTDRIIKKLRYTIRMIVFALPFFGLLAANAYFFKWIPLDTMHWLVFTAIFVIVLLVMTIAFEIYYKAMGKKYDGLLGQYRRQREAQNK
jgi:hypothetical protein